LPNQLVIGVRSSPEKKLLSKQLSGLVSAKTVTVTIDTSPQERSLPAAIAARALAESF
jgi:hypothetical protein